MNKEKFEEFNRYRLMGEGSFEEQIKDLFGTSLTNNISKVIVKSAGAANVATGHQHMLIGEFQELSGIQKNTVLNINVIGTISNRVFKDHQLIAFYFELYQEFVFNTTLRYGPDSFVFIRDLILEATIPPAYSVSSVETFGFINDSVLAGTVQRNPKVVDAIKFNNPWYLIVILFTFFYTYSLDNIVAMFNVEKA